MMRATREITLLTLLVLSVLPLQGADTLPEKIADEDYWKLIGTLSEPSGSFQSENLLSNEIGFPAVMSRLESLPKPGGVYLGVGPEQNFNYIATVRPKIAFIIDIRRQNMLEHLIYKAVFELSPDRASFVSRLFSRKQPTGLMPGLTAAELFDAYLEQPPDKATFEKNLKDIEDLLTGAHKFVLTREDRLHLEDVYTAFREFGPLIDYNSRGGGPSGRAFSPSYARLMTETDGSGHEWSYLASEERYRVVRDLESRNLIVPITGDFGGPGAIRAVGKYVKDRGAVVSAFYVSNVEGYLFRGGDRIGNPNGGAAKFYANVATLPLDAASTFIRWIPGRGFTRDNEVSIFLASILRTVHDFDDGRLTAADFFPTQAFGPGRNFFARSLLNSDPRRGAVVQTWAARVRIVFCLFAAAAAFMVRYFVLSTMLEREAIPSRRRFAYSFAWAVAAFVLAFIFNVVFRSWLLHA